MEPSLIVTILVGLIGGVLTRAYRRRALAAEAGLAKFQLEFQDWLKKPIVLTQTAEQLDTVGKYVAGVVISKLPANAYEDKEKVV